MEMRYMIGSVFSAIFELLINLYHLFGLYKVYTIIELIRLQKSKQQKGLNKYTTVVNLNLNSVNK